MAAGLGFKTFTTGEVLTAADTNGYLMQGILVFATEAARNSAITSPQEGQFAFTKDTNSTWYYDGAAWVASGASGDVTGVTAGTGITVTDPTGPVPTVTNSMATAITTNGDLIYGTGSGTFTRRGIGSTGQVLTVASGIPSWATPASGGKLAQVVSTAKTSAFTTGSTSFTDITGLSVTITPAANTSKIYVSVAVSGGGTNGSSGIYYNLVRGSTNIAVGDSGGGSPETLCTSAVQSFDVNNVPSTAIVFYDAPATTSATTYKIQMKVDAATGYINRSSSGNYGRSVSTITVMEILA